MDEVQSEPSLADTVEESTEIELDPNNPDHAFAILEKSFNQTVANMEAEPSAAIFVDDFTRLMDELYKTRTQQHDIQSSYDELNTELQARNHQLGLLQELTEADKVTIEELKQQIDNAWKLADNSHAREQLAQETIDNLRKQIDALNAEIEFRNKMSQDDDEVSDKNKEGLEREKERLIGEVNQLNQKLNNALGYQEELERKNSLADVKVHDIEQKYEDQIEETERIKKLKQGIEKEISGLKEIIDEREQFITELQGEVKIYKKEIANLEAEIKDQKAVIEKLTKENEHAAQKAIKTLDDIDKLTFQLTSFKTKYNQLITDTRQCQDEVTHQKNDIARLTKARDILEKRQIHIEHEKENLSADRNNLRQRIVTMEREIVDGKKHVDELKRENEKYFKEKEILNKQIIRNERVSEEQQILFKLQEQSKKKLETELDSFFIESNKMKKIISVLERERDRLSEDQIILKKQIEDSMDDIKIKKVEIFELKKSLAEQQTHIRMQQNMFEALRADKNALQKLLQESSAEGNELKKKLKVCSHQTEQLKEDIAMKDHLLIKEEKNMKKLMKEKENLRVEVDNGLEQIKSLKQAIAEMKDEEKRLHKTIMDNERTIRQQAKDLEQLMNERDIIGAQLVRRNDEISLLHEKIVILETTLNRGEAQYDQRLQDIRLLKIEIKRLRQEKNLMTKTANNMVDLRQEVFHLERDLTKAHLKCRALEEEVQNPLNIHRWRKLEGSDPEVLDLLQKTQMLQRRLLHQTSEAVERERKLKEAEKLYLNLKQVLAKQPGPAVVEQLSNTQRALKLRGNKLKCLVSELNMAELQVAEYKSDLQKVSEEYVALKQKYLDERKAHQQLKRQYEKERDDFYNRAQSSMVAPQRKTTSPGKFVGGGFRMAVQENIKDSF